MGEVPERLREGGGNGEGAPELNPGTAPAQVETLLTVGCQLRHITLSLLANRMACRDLCTLRATTMMPGGTDLGDTH